MGEVLPQGNPPKSLRGRPRTPVRLLTHEKAQLGINVRVSVTEKRKMTLMAKRCGLSLSEYLRQRALGYEPGGHPPKEVFNVLDKLDEIAENCSAREGAAINAQTDRMRDLLIGGN